MTKSSQNQQWILTAVRMVEIKKKKKIKKNSFNHGRYILQYGTEKLMIPTRRTKCIFTALQGDAHLYSWLPKWRDFGRALIFRAHTLYTGREKQGKKKKKVKA